jgi:hypothetical protein
MPARPTRSQRILLRVSPIERSTIETRARAAGLTVSEYLRSQSCGDLPADVRPPAPEPGHTAAELQAQRDAWDAELKQKALLMPKRNAERLMGSRP